MTQSNMSLLIKGTLNIYLEASTQATKTLFRNWILIPVTLLAYFLFSLIFLSVSGLGIAGGFLAGFFYVAFLSFYYMWLSASVNKERLRLKNLLEFDWSLFSNVMSVGFILWIASMFVRPFASTSETMWIYGCLSLAIFILLNPIPEIIYIRRYDRTYALTYSFNFIKENWIEWFLPLILVFLPLLLANPLGLLVSVAGVDGFSSGPDPLFPARLIFSKILTYLNTSLGSLAVLIAVILTNWFMLFRGYLFLKLDGSTRRQRAYRMRNS